VTGPEGLKPTGTRFRSKSTATAGPTEFVGDGDELSFGFYEFDPKLLTIRAIRSGFHNLPRKPAKPPGWIAWPRQPCRFNQCLISLLTCRFPDGRRVWQELFPDD
jgi:hypothetical protein